MLSQFPADITDIDAVRELASAIHNLGPAMDVVMNVAGIAAWGTVDTLEHRQWRAMVEVNLMGPIHVIESFVPAMIERGEGGALVNVSSAAGLIGLPWHAAYSATNSACAAYMKYCVSTLHGTASVCTWSAPVGSRRR